MFKLKSILFFFFLSPPLSLLLWAQPSRPLFPSFFPPFSLSPCSLAHSLPLLLLFFCLRMVSPRRGPASPRAALLFLPSLVSPSRALGPFPRSRPNPPEPRSFPRSLSLWREGPARRNPLPRAAPNSGSSPARPARSPPPPYPSRARTSRHPAAPLLKPPPPVP
jgi:hypothetical protein